MNLAKKVLFAFVVGFVALRAMDAPTKDVGHNLSVLWERQRELTEIYNTLDDAEEKRTVLDELTRVNASLRKKEEKVKTVTKDEAATTIQKYARAKQARTKLEELKKEKYKPSSLEQIIINDLVEKLQIALDENNLFEFYKFDFAISTLPNERIKNLIREQIPYERIKNLISGKIFLQSKNYIIGDILPEYTYIHIEPTIRLSEKNIIVLDYNYSFDGKYHRHLQFIDLISGVSFFSKHFESEFFLDVELSFSKNFETFLVQHHTESLIQLYEVGTGDLLYELKLDEGSVSAHYDGEGDTKIHIHINEESESPEYKTYSIATGAEISNKDHYWDVSEDGKLAFDYEDNSDSEDEESEIESSGWQDPESIRVIDTTTAETILTLDHPKNVLKIEFLSGSSTKAITASYDGIVRVWNVLTGDVLQEFKHDNPVTYFEFSADKQLLIVFSSPYFEDPSNPGIKTNVTIWDFKKGKLLYQVEQDFDDNTKPNNFYILNDKKLVLEYYDWFYKPKQRIELINLDSGKILKTIEIKESNIFYRLNIAKNLFFDDNKIYNLNTGNILQKIDADDAKFAVWSQDGNMFVRYNQDIDKNEIKFIFYEKTNLDAVEIDFAETLTLLKLEKIKITDLNEAQIGKVLSLAKKEYRALGKELKKAFKERSSTKELHKEATQLRNLIDKLESYQKYLQEK